MISRTMFCAGAALTVILCAVVSAVTANVVLGRAHDPNVTVQSLTLQDGAGHVLATLAADHGAPALTLFDKQHRKRAAFFTEVQSGAPDLYLYDQNGTERTALDLYDSGAPNLYLGNRDAAPSALTDLTADGSLRVAITELRDGNLRTLGALYLSAAQGKPQLRLEDSAKHTVWHTP